MTTRRLLLVLAGCAGWLLSIVLIVYFLNHDGRNGSSHRSTLEAGDVSSSIADGNGLQLEVAPPSHLRTAVDGLTTLSICERSGVPVRGAGIAARSFHDREWDNGNPEILARSDIQGLAVFNSDWIRNNSNDVLCVMAPGFLPGEVPVQSLLDGSETLVLDSGLEHVIRCIDLDELPIAGVGIRVSHASLDVLFDRPAVPQFPGGNTDTAIHYATTDQRGDAAFKGLSPGQYNLSVDPTEFALLSGRPKAGTFMVPDAPTILQFGAIVAVVIKYEVDTPLNSTVRLPSSYISYNHAQAAVERARVSLRSRFDADVIAAFAVARPGRRDPVKVRSLFDEWGVQDFDVEVRAYSDIREPTVLKASHTRGSPLVDCTVSILDGSGLLPDFDELSINLDTQLGPAGLTVKVQNDKVMRLPPGEYTLHSRNPWLRQSLAKRVVRAPGTNGLVLADIFRRCRIWFVEPARKGSAQFSMRVSDSSGRSMTKLMRGPDPLVVWLPVGQYSIECRISESDGTTQSAFIEPPPEPAAIQEVVIAGG